MADVQISAHNYMSNVGRAYVYYGRRFDPGVLFFEQPFADPTVLLAQTSRGDCFGMAWVGARAVGDLNGDGYADVVIGAPCPITTPRSAYVYYGAAVGLGAGERVAADASLLGGTFIAGVGDVDGDGYGDVAIGDTNRWEPRDSGLVRIHFGGADCLLRRVVTLEGTTRTTSRFGFSVNGGDFDGDGLGDLVMGAPADLYDCGTSSTSVGSGAFLFLGASLARSRSPSASWAGTVGVDGGFGSVVSSLDYNGDGRSDVLVTALCSPPRLTLYQGTAGLPLTMPTMVLPFWSAH